MKTHHFFLSMLVLLFISCDDDEKIKLGDNHVSVGVNTYVVSDAIISQSATSPNVKNLSFTGTFLGSSTDGKTQVIAGETLQFTMEIFQLNLSVLVGEYSLGDLNDDGIINANDAAAQGYLPSAFYSNTGLITLLKFGSLTLSNANAGTVRVQFDLLTEGDMKVKGNLVATTMN